MKEDGANITRGRAKDCPRPLAGGAEVCRTSAAMNLFIRSSSAGGECVIWNVNERNPSLFSSAYLQSSPYLICSRWSTQVGMSERRWWRGGAIFNPDRLLSGENETIYSPMICWYAVAGSPDNHADKDSDAYPLIPWFFFFFFRPSGFTPIIAQPNKGGRGFLKGAGKLKSVNLPVFWCCEDGRLAASMQSEGTWRHTKPVLNSPCDRLQVCVHPAPTPPPLFILWDDDFQKQEIHKDSQKDADATSQSHLPTQQHKLCCVLDTVAVMLGLKKYLTVRKLRENERGAVLMCWHYPGTPVVMRLKWVGIFSCVLNLPKPFSQSNSSQN